MGQEEEEASTSATGNGAAKATSQARELIDMHHCWMHLKGSDLTPPGIFCSWRDSARACE